MQTLEQLWRAMFRGVPSIKTQSANNQFAGRTTLNSGSATVTVSTTLVGSDSVILLGAQAPTNQASGVANRSVEVKSINPTNHFIIGTSDGQAIARNTIVSWVLFKAS